ncbi:MAG: hypothetical protein U1F43_16200 [Myxococcota bacterium]
MSIIQKGIDGATKLVAGLAKKGMRRAAIGFGISLSLLAATALVTALRKRAGDAKRAKPADDAEAPAIGKRPEHHRAGSNGHLNSHARRAIPPIG